MPGVLLAGANKPALRDLVCRFFQHDVAPKVLGSEEPSETERRHPTPVPTGAGVDGSLRCCSAYYRRARTTIDPPERVENVVVWVARQSNIAMAGTLAAAFEPCKWVFMFSCDKLDEMESMASRATEEGSRSAKPGQDTSAKPILSKREGVPHAGRDAPPKNDAACNGSGTEPKSRGRLILRREKKHRGGKTVVIVAGLRSSAHLAESEIEKLAQHLKQQLGCGGAVERVTNDTEIVIQGDQPARIAELLRAQRFRVDGVTS